MNVLRDARYGVRMLRRNPGFTAVAVLALALGIAANTAIFSVVYATLLAPLPYREPERLVRVYESTPDWFSDSLFLRHANMVWVDERKAPARQEAMKASASAQRYKIALEQASSAMLGGDALLHALTLHPELDAIFFANDDLAVGAILRAQREGIAVPGRVAIAGFNGLGLAELVQPTLTTIVSPRLEIGRIAAQQLLDQLNGRPPRRRRVDVSFELAARQST